MNDAETLKLAQDAIAEAKAKAEEQAVQHEDNYERLEHPVVAEAYGVVQGLEQAEGIIAGLLTEAVTS